MKNIFKSIRENYRLVLGVLLTGLFLGWLFFHPSKAEPILENQLIIHEGHDHPAEDGTVWTCSMHPQVRQDLPGQCPICGMDLIPLQTRQSAGDEMDPNEIAMTESAAKLADIQTMEVISGTPQKIVYLQGKVQADERNMAELTARFGGRIEKLFVNYTGQHVQKGEKLATIYSPDLITAQRELLEALSFKESRPAFYTAARAKLKLWDLTDDQMNAIEANGEPLLYFDVLSPISGTVMKRHVALGDYVKEGSALFQVVDLKHVWVMLDAYESDLPWVNKGDQVAMTIQAIPGKIFEGRVSYIDPYIDAISRIARVRIELPNEGLKLKPEMFANGVLYSTLSGLTGHLMIPKSAVLWTGKRSVVYVKVPERESPIFRYREITLGPEAGNYYLVAGGLHEGEEVAVNGVFKIDAAAQLEGKSSMMNPVAGRAPAGHDHEMKRAKEGGARVDDQTMTGAISESFKIQLQKAYDSYILMKDAFVTTDAKEVAEYAGKLKASLNEVDMELLEREAHMLWMKYLKEMDSTLASISSGANIKDQRLAFARFNVTFYNSIKAFGLHQDTIYYQYCPMANGDQGAYWFSNQDEIRNPYFGDEMLTCGETRDTITF